MKFECGLGERPCSRSPMAGVGGRDAVLGPGAAALERVPPVHDALAGDGEVPQAVVLLLDARVGHGRHPGALLRQAEQVGPRPVRNIAAPAGGLDGLRPGVVGAAAKPEGSGRAVKQQQQTQRRQQQQQNNNNQNNLR